MSTIVLQAPPGRVVAHLRDQTVQQIAEFMVSTLTGSEDSFSEGKAKCVAVLIIDGDKKKPWNLYLSTYKGYKTLMYSAYVIQHDGGEAVPDSKSHFNGPFDGIERPQDKIWGTPATVSTLLQLRAPPIANFNPNPNPKSASSGYIDRTTMHQPFIQKDA
jgi:hypothetical protein